MRLTPLGKTLVFLIGLGLVAAAVYLYGPRMRDQAEALRARREARRGAEPPRGEPPSERRSQRGAEVETRAGGPWVEVPGGLFGAGAEQVSVDQPAFRIHRTEVTNAQYQTYLDDCPVGAECGPRDLPSYWDDAAYLETRGEHPVVFVSWADASGYCRWIGARLPAAIEWEKAARGTDGRAFPTGAALDPDAVNILGTDRHDEKLRAPKQIATWAVTDPRYARDVSPYGVLGMGGNVSEWTASAAEEEPDLRLAAGGSWDSWDLSDARVYHRLPKNPADRSSSLGFRCAAGVS
jgi:formylglycine-generating enzyme required for sulfatase activity